MKTKLLFSSIFCASALSVMAALPASPLITEYTISGAETLTDSPYTINGGGKLNIGSDANGEGSLQINYTDATQYLKGSGGIINIGTANTAGSLSVTGTNAAIPAEKYQQIINFYGTVNVAEKGTLTIDGYIPSSWGEFVTCSTLNLRGALVAKATVSSNSYLEFVNMNVYAGASISSTQNFRTVGGGIWNLYTTNIKTPKIRFGNTSGVTSTINVHGAKILNSVSEYAYDTASVTQNINVTSNDQTMGTLNICDLVKFNLTLAGGENSGAFIIKSLSSKNGVMDYKATFNFKNFENDTIFISLTNGVEINSDNKLYIKNVNAIIDLNAFTGTSEDSKIDGKWSLVWNQSLGYYALNNSAIPEPARVAALLGALALGLAIYRRRK